MDVNSQSHSQFVSSVIGCPFFWEIQIGISILSPSTEASYSTFIRLLYSIPYIVNFVNNANHYYDNYEAIQWN